MRTGMIWRPGMPRWPRCWASWTGSRRSPPARTAGRPRPRRSRSPARCDQDVDLSGLAPALRQGVAKDRRISVEDGDMRHGRKSRSVLVDGYKRHVLRDLDTGLVPAVGITPANAPEASVTGDIETDLGAAGWTLAELHIDRAYLSSALVRDRGPDLAVYCKAWRVRNT